jgi:hypothetical protein
MYTTQTIPGELEDKVKRELQAGERIRWMEQPIPRFFTSASTTMFLFGIPWTVFALFWEVIACGGVLWSISRYKEAPGVLIFFIVFPLFGLPFVLAGFGMLASPFRARRNALKTVYVITDQRAITFDAGWTTTVRSYPPDRLQNIYRKERIDGTGDVIFGQRVWRNSESGQRAQDLGFLNIRETKRAEQMLRELAQQCLDRRK